MDGSSGDHWDRIFDTRLEADRSWTEPVPEPSLRAIERRSLALEAPIIDVGGGASRLIDHLIAKGHSDLTVLDVSRSALCQARARVGHEAHVEWIHADLMAWIPPRQYALWHDRAVFHFLTEASLVAQYCSIVTAGVAPRGHLVLATFAPDGPSSCSGLPVRRWSAPELAAVFAASFDMVESSTVDHHTPSGAVQPFTWVTLRRSA